jgi:aspartate 1-decarboxylase
MRTMLRSKIHRATVTDVNVAYEGSITIDKDLMEAADIIAYERVEVLDINNGTRFSTYAIEGGRGTGEICINGAAARICAKRDIVIILSYHDVTDEQARDATPNLVYVDSSNKITSVKNKIDSISNLINNIN